MDALGRLDERPGGTAAAEEDPEAGQLSRVIVANFARSRRNDGVPQ